MKCPDCGAPTIVVDSRERKHYIMRRRRCRACGLRFTTRETIEKEQSWPASKN